MHACYCIPRACCKRLCLWIYLSTNVCFQLSPWSMLQGQVCGLCGNNNYDTSDDFTDLEGLPFTDSRQFVLGHVLPSTTCDARNFETLLNVRHEGKSRL